MKFKKSFLFISMLICVAHLGAMEDPDKSTQEELQEELLDAYENDNIQKFISIINQGADIYWGGYNSNGRDFDSLMYCAAGDCKVEFMNVLLKNGVDINSTKNNYHKFTPLQAFCFSSICFDSTGYSLNSMSFDYKECIYGTKVFKCLKFLLEQGADLDAGGKYYWEPYACFCDFQKSFNQKPESIACFYLMLCYKKNKKDIIKYNYYLKDFYNFLSEEEKVRCKGSHKQIQEVFSIKHQLVQWRYDFLNDSKNEKSDITSFNIFVFKQWLKLEENELWGEEDCYFKTLLEIIIDGKFIENIVFGEKQKDNASKEIYTEKLMRILELAYDNEPSSNESSDNELPNSKPANIYNPCIIV